MTSQTKRSETTNHDLSADYGAIRDLVDRYHAAVNMRDWLLLESVFTPDAVWWAREPLNLRFAGIEALSAGLKASVLRQEILVQGYSGLQVEISGNSARVRSTLTEFGREVGAQTQWEAVAFYADVVTKLDGAWRFAERILHLRYMREGLPSGLSFELHGGLHLTPQVPT